MTALFFVSNFQRQLLQLDKSVLIGKHNHKHFYTIKGVLSSISKNKTDLHLKISQKCFFQSQTFRSSQNKCPSRSSWGWSKSFCFANFGQFLKRHFCTENLLDLNVKNVVHDVIIYSNKNESFFKILSYAGVFQMILWGYLSFFAVQDLRVAPLKDTSNLPLWKRLLYKEGQYKNAISVLSLAVGCAILFISLSYPRRAIKSLWLLKGGQEVKITTFSPFGKENTFIKPILHINCLEARTGAGPYIPLQIKDKYFFFLLDKKGQFHNTNLFDFLIGIKRKI